MSMEPGDRVIWDRIEGDDRWTIFGVVLDRYRGGYVKVAPVGRGDKPIMSKVEVLPVDMMRVLPGGKAPTT